MMTTETVIPKTLQAFGKEYCLQGVFEDLDEMEKCKKNWLAIGHKHMIKKNNRLYVTRFKQ